ncbi:MAG: hypothetical protein ACRD98_09180 [Nitrososphaera sp.]
MKRRQFIAIAIVLVVAGIVGIVSSGYYARPLHSSMNDTDQGLLTIKELFARGVYQHLVETRFDQESVDIMRGGNVTVQFTVEHFSHVWWESATVKNFQNRFTNYSPSGDEVPAGNYLKYSPPEMVLPSNSTARGSVTISLPADVPNEMLNTTIKITASFDVTYVLAGDENVARNPDILYIRIIG